jgi:putative RecB family exonuclease
VTAQLPMEGVPTRLYPCTPTRLLTWLDCPRKYRYTYLDRPAPPKGPPWAHNSVGSAVHLALAAWHRQDPGDRTPARAAHLLDSAWLREGFRDDDQAEAWQRRARDMVVGYTEGLDPHDEPIGIERTVATKTASLAFSGRVDRLDRRTIDGVDRLVVVDYKTGRKPLTEYDARSSLALALYAYAVTHMFRRPCLRVELHHLPSGTVVAHEHTRESLERHLTRAEALAAEAQVADRDHRQGLDDAEAQERFPTQPSAACRWCDFLRVCPDGRAQYEPAASWAALDAAES